MTDTELLDAALQTLVNFEFDIPCDVLNDTDDSCYKTCKYDHPMKECWRRLLEVKAKKERITVPVTDTSVPDDAVCIDCENYNSEEGVCMLDLIPNTPFNPACERFKPKEDKYGTY